MAKNKLPKKNDEYHFTEEHQETPIIEPVEKPQRRGIRKILFNRNFIVLLILIVAVALVYQFLGRRRVSEENLDVAQPTISPEPRQPVPSIAPTVTTTTVVGPSLESQVSDLRQQVEQNQTQIQQLQSGLAQLTNQITNLNNNINALTQSISKPPVVKTVVVRPTPPPSSIYYVRAVIPGRAWLQLFRNNHVVKTVSVAVGDYLPGFGTVTAISATRGTVSISGGTVFKFKKIANGA